MTLEQLIKKLIEIKKKGFIKTVRAHDGGVGNTLESLLEIKENNFSLPDIGEIELKAKRIKSSSMLTLISKAPLPPKVNRILFKSYSRITEDGIRKLYTTIYGSRQNPRGFRVILQENNLILKNRKNIKAYWQLDSLFKNLRSKADRILLVYAKTEGKKGSNDEMFHYIEAYLLSSMSIKKFKDAIKNGKLKIDIRIGADRRGKKIGIYHDHGTGIRISKPDFLELFSKHSQLM